MKRITTVFVSVFFTLVLLISGVSAERTLPLIVDSADLLAQAEEELLISKLQSISESLSIEVAIVTVNSTGGKSAMEYADDFYDQNGYGYGENDDGVLLLINMGEREWWITTHGYGEYCLGDYTLYLIEEAIIDYLSDGNYYAAFLTFAQMCEFYVEQAQNPDYVPDDYYGDVTLEDDEWNDFYDEPEPGTFDKIKSRLGVSLVIGFVIAFIMVSAMKSGMKTVRGAPNAAGYVVNGSLNLRVQRDYYLYSNTVRTRRQSSSSSSHSPSSRSGSSSHRSFSGRSHGGRGGRF